MKTKHLILSLLALLASEIASAQDYYVGQTFTVTQGMKYVTNKNTSGWYSMQCEVTSVSSNNACEVRIYSNSSLDHPSTGKVTQIEIPQFVYYNDNGFLVTSIGQLGLFKGGTAGDIADYLQKAILPPTLEKIENTVFYQCDELAEISGADNLRIIGKQAFYDCRKLKPFPDTDFSSVEEIGNWAFHFCDSLRTANLTSIKKLGSHAFHNRGNSTTQSSTPMGLTSLVLGEQLKDSIPQYCFSGNNKLTSPIKIPEGVTRIGEYAFYSTSISSFEIPSSVRKIEKSAFSGGISKRRFTLHATTPPTAPTNLGIMSTDTIYVPLGYASAYQAANGWNSGVIIEKDLRENQSISLTSIPAMTYGETSYTLPATTNQGQSLSWTSSNTTVATISGRVLSIKGAGTCTITATQTGSNQYLPFNQTYNLTINKATLTITANNISIQQGEAIPPFSVTYSGFKYSDNESVLTSQPNITCNATSASAPGTYDINVSGASAKNYNINYVKGTLTITEAQPVTITANSYTRVYGDENPAFEFTSEGAPLNGVPEISCSATSTSPVGTYPITITKGTVQNYNDTYVSGTLTITKAPLVITANDASMVQGSELPEFTASYSGFKNGENEGVLTAQPSFSCSATGQSPAGTYPITASGAAAANYNISYVEGTLTVIDETLLNNRLYAETVSLRTGTSKTFGLKLDNTLTFIACEFYLQLPEGVRIETDEDDYMMAELVSGRINRHSLEVDHVGNGLYHFLCYSNKNYAFKGQSGDLITITVACDENVVADTYTATIKDIIFSDQDKHQVDLLDSSFDVVVTDIIPGDANGDEKINVMDIVEIVGYIMGNSSDTFVFGAADMDENGTINVMDLVNVVSLIMTNANQPTAAPRRRSAAPMRADATDDELSVTDFSIAAGETKEVSMVLNNPTNEYIAFEFWMSLPDGVRIAYDGEGELMATLNASRADGHDFIVEEPNGDGIYHFLCYSGRNKRLKGNSGELISLTLTCADDATVGNATGTIYDMIFSDPDKNEINLADATFSITVTEAGDGRILLDENSTTVPALATNVDVRVKRTIKANEWSTIVLPFAMSAEQVKEVFGGDVQLADFTGTEPEFDNDDNCVGVMVNFDAATAIEANHPYIIKVSQPVEEFTIDGVDIVADEDEAYIEFDNGLTGRKRVVYSGFYGTYHAGTEVPEYCLFLNGNKFWYSTGQTTMKAFRAYFEFIDILAEVENAAGVVEFNINFDDATGIDNVNANLNHNKAIFNLAGQRVGKNYKGVVIKDGKKIAVK